MRAPHLSPSLSLAYTFLTLASFFIAQQNVADVREKAATRAGAGSPTTAPASEEPSGSRSAAEQQQPAECLARKGQASANQGGGDRAESRTGGDSAAQCAAAADREALRSEREGRR